MRIYLIGPMGSGKSKIGKLLASALNFSLVDIDKDIEKKFKKSIVEIFEVEGEESFRAKESIFLKELSSESNTIISTGGGVIEKTINREILKNEKLVVFLSASVEKQYLSTLS